MAFAAQLSALTDELIEAICSPNFKPDRGRLNALRESSLRSLRRHTFVRTNQFLVDEQLSGLEEKFIVNGRDGLASALRTSLDALSARSNKWTPEILHLFLELSDRPLQQSHLSDLETLREPEVKPGLPLKWEEIAEEDGWTNERALWKNVDFAATSSDDEIYEEEPAGNSSDSDATSVSGDTLQLDRLLQPAEARRQPLTLNHAANSQSWRLELPQRDSEGRVRKVLVTEAQVIRESLFMLQGHTTTLFDSKRAPMSAYQLAGVSWDTYRALVTSVSEAGRPLRSLRAFVEYQQDIPLLQTFQDCIRQSLRVFDGEVARLQARFVDLKADMVVSMLAVMEELKPHLVPLRVMSTVVEKLREERYPHAFRYLELLFDAICASQMEGDDFAYRSLGAIFFECFQIYLRPIRAWMDEGQLLPGDKIFFVSESSVKVPLNQVWESQFKLRQTRDGILHAPKFLQPAVSRIFTTGKSIVVLKQLGRYDSTKKSLEEKEFRLNFADVCPPSFDLAPFSDLFGDAFDTWIKSKHRTTSSSLQKVLFESCGLWSTLDALQILYLMADGAASDSFASTIFDNIDRKRSGWHDRFTLTETAQEAFSVLLDADRISVTFDNKDQHRQQYTPSRESVREVLPRVKLLYRMAWPVQIVIPGQCLDNYQQVFTMLLQLRRSIHILNRHRLLRDQPALSSFASASKRAEQELYYRLRTRLLWFCNAFLTYLVTLVFTPNVAALKRELSSSEDVDGMKSCHATFLAVLIQEACLGPRLGPIRECTLDVLDLVIELEGARERSALKDASEEQEVLRLSVMSSPGRALSLSPADFRKSQLRGLYVSPKEKEENQDLDGDGGRLAGRLVKSKTQKAHQLSKGFEAYSVTLGRISADLDRHLRFITGGLRGVARASSDTAAGKWDMLAEMLETGVVAR